MRGFMNQTRHLGRYVQLSLIASWGIVDQASDPDPLDLQVLYNNMVELFEGDDFHGVLLIQDTLAWWNL